MSVDDRTTNNQRNAVLEMLIKQIETVKEGNLPDEREIINIVIQNLAEECSKGNPALNLNSPEEVKKALSDYTKKQKQRNDDGAK